MPRGQWYLGAAVTSILLKAGPRPPNDPLAKLQTGSRANATRRVACRD